MNSENKLPTCKKSLEDLESPELAYLENKILYLKPVVVESQIQLGWGRGWRVAGGRTH